MTPLFDAQSGELLALPNGTNANPFKTDAADGVVVDALTRDDTSTLALIGNSAQACGQLRTTVAVRGLDSTWVYSPTKESRRSFAGEMGRTFDASVAAVASSTAAVEGTNIVVTATTATDSVSDGDLLDSGTYVTAMDQYHPEKHELGEITTRRVTYVPDLRERATTGVGSFLAAAEAGVTDEDHIHAELGEVVAGVAAGRESREEITVFDSSGTGIETVTTAHMLYEKAHEEGLETIIGFSPASGSPTGQ